MSQRTLYVDIVRAKNIIGVNKKGGTSDPYIVAWLQNIAGREIKKEKFQTKTVNKTLAPEWNERFTFGQAYDLNTTGDLPTLVLSMYHVGGLLQTDEAMGKVTIPLDTIDPNGGTASSWYPLVGDSRTMKFAAAGEVRTTTA
jgi:Ca2+-dependent lipid-binding protein